MSGFFITFEGIEGTGKTTQAKALTEALKKQGLPVIFTREPGGSKTGDHIRNILADPANTDMTPMTEFLLFAASRAQHAEKLIRPFLEEGYIVISDRFADSSLAYQGFGRGIPIDFVKEVNSAAAWNLSPDLTFYLDLTPEESMKRVRLRIEETETAPDRLERERLDFFRKVNDGYFCLMKDEPFRFRAMTAAAPPDEIHKKIMDITVKELRKAGFYRKNAVADNINL